MNIEIFAKSSSNPDEPYIVTFISENGILRVLCSCPAGIHGQLCKHKEAFFEGNVNILYDKSQLDLLNDAMSIVNASTLKNDYFYFLQKKKEIELIQNSLKKELKTLKSNLASKLKNGIML